MQNLIFVLCVGFGLGILYQVIIHDILDNSHYESRCIELNYAVSDPTDGSVWQIGEQVVCGRDWAITNVLGPDLEAHLADGGLTFTEPSKYVAPDG